MPRRNLIWIAILLAMAVVLLLVWQQPRNGHGNRPTEFHPVEQTYRVIRESYYRPIEPEDLQRAAVRGMVSTLDEFSTYVSPEQAERLTGHVLGEHLGLGLELSFDENVPVVVGPHPNSPAHKAGIFADDRILAINDTPTKDLTPKQVRLLLSRPTDKSFRLTLRDALTGKKRRVKLTPATFPVETVQGLYRDATGRRKYRLPGQGKLVYVRITEFCPHTAQQLGNELRRLGNIGGLVLDLRDNPGGLLANGVAVADLFLREGAIVHVLERDNKRQTHQAHPDTPYGNTPLVVLIDDLSTSAAEIVAGALAANARAVLLGQRTHGKGCVQTMIRLPGHLGQVHLTTAEFLLPPDQTIQRRKNSNRWGVDPQVALERNEEQTSVLRRRWQGAAVIPRSAVLSPPDTKTPPKAVTKSDLARTAIKADPQLALAVQLLRKPKEMDAILKVLAARNRQARETFRRKQADRVRKTAKTKGRK